MSRTSTVSSGIARRLPLVCGLVACLGSAGHASAQPSRPPLPRSHRHPNVEPLTPAVDFPELALADTTLPPGPTDNRVTDRERRYDAFTVADTRLFVVDRTTRKAREIRGVPFEWRPFSNLAWAGTRTLLFDRWSSPHVGVHYAVDVVTGTLVAAWQFHEEPRPAGAVTAPRVP